MDQDADRKASGKVVEWARLCPLRCQAGVRCEAPHGPPEQCWSSEPVTDGIRAVPSCFIASCTRMDEGGGKPSPRPPSVVAWCCGHPVQRARQAAGGRELGSLGEWPCTRAYTELGGVGCHAPDEWGILWRTVALVDGSGR
ncbi:hypothetical protein HAX54_046317 [Datura stramonium]|uniref:Uncharacterized protein n=1 Tax=Datura stramonium TaxID=4076 RepID=A0ABS8WJ04_DATST|nr:hypothetical protein [Datura stramonium]